MPTDADDFEVLGPTEFVAKEVVTHDHADGHSESCRILAESPSKC
jgi:hypothetical protein